MFALGWNCIKGLGGSDSADADLGTHGLDWNGICPRVRDECCIDYVTVGMLLVTLVGLVRVLML